MTTRRLVAATTIGISAWLLAVGLAVDRFVMPLVDAVLGAPATALALATVVGAVVLRPAGAVILSSIGILLGLLAGFYAVSLLDSAPTTIRERANLVFGLGFLGPFVVVWALRLRVAAWLGVAAGLALGAAVALAMGGHRGALAPEVPVGERELVAGVVGLALLGTWALTIARTLQDERLIGRIGAAIPRLPTPLHWRWTERLPARVVWLARLAGLAAIGDGAIRLLLAPVAVQTTALETVEVGVAAAWVLFALGLMRAAPRFGEVTATGLVLFEWLLPVSIPGATLISAVVLVAPISAFPSGEVQPIEIANGAGAILALAVARLAWSLRRGRTTGVLVAVLLIVGAFAAGGAASSAPLPLARDFGAALGGMAWLAFGLWLLRLAGHLRGVTPLWAFRPPRDASPFPDHRPAGQPAPAQAGRPARRRRLAPAGGGRSRRRTPAFVQSVTRQRRWLRERTRSRHDLDELARRLGVTAAELRAFRPAYRTFEIPKRAGGKRTITAPDAATKAIQRRIHRRLLARLPAHATAHGFERQRSIVTNAVLHAGPAVLVKLDIQDFFGQTRAARIRRYWRILGWNREAARTLTRLTTDADGLPQGAPTSPRLANLVNIRLDARLAGIARTHGARYSRYADDLTFSFAADDGPAVRQLIHAVRNTVWSEGRYRLHVRRKTEIRRRHERQSITGLVVNGGAPRLSRARRHWLRAVEHRYYSGGAPTIDAAALRGWQAFEAMIELQGKGPTGA